MAEKILVVDDHQETINLVSMILKRQGYRLILGRSGKEGLTLAEQEDPDLILLDVMMPDMDGLEVCRRLRAQERFTRTPIIMFTAKSMADEKWEGFQAGATDYLVKPTNTDELTKRVRAVLNRSSKPLVRQVADTGSLIAKAGRSEETAVRDFRPQSVAFIGARGGSGATTAAINTAFIFARLYPALLVDLDMGQGHVSQYLNLEFKGGLNDLLAGGIVAMRGQLAHEVHVVNSNLHLLLSRPNLIDTETQIEPKQVPHLYDALVRSTRQVFIDAGRGITPINRPLLERVDHIVICLKPERLGIAGAKTLLAHLEEIILPTTTLHVMMLNFDERFQVPQGAIESFIGQKILNVVQITSAQMAQAVNRGQPLVKTHSDSDLPKAFALVARALVAV